MQNENSSVSMSNDSRKVTNDTESKSPDSQYKKIRKALSLVHGIGSSNYESNIAIDL
jgi:hypothetical protein